jgi:F0F1-type ATP synthase epsilon subunit
MTSRVSGGCVYILPNELSILVTLAKEGATSLERREALMNALRKQGKFAPA